MDNEHEKHNKIEMEDLQQIRDNLRFILEGSKILPYVEVTWHRDISGKPYDEKTGDTTSPLARTCMVFETIINTLMASYSSYQSMIAVNFLSHLTVTLDQLSMLIGEVLMEENNPKLLKVLDLLKQRDLENRIDNDDLHEIPDVFKQAFGEDE